MADDIKNEVSNEHEDVISLDTEGNPISSDNKDSNTTQSSTSEDVAGDDLVPEEGDPATIIKKLRDKLKQVTAEKTEYLNNWQRDKAEFINVRKREQESNAQFVKFAKEDLIVDLIPVLDSFEMAFSNKEAWEKVDKNWRIGVEHIYSQLKNILTNNNLQEIDPLGKRFDPARDEAIEFEPVTEERFDHMITKVIQKGYSLNDKIIKAPRVKVGEFKKPE